jgi:tetraacyldisaccharide 4'-kinase
MSSQQRCWTIWSKRGVLACVLWPLSLVFSLLVRMRRQLYERQLLPSHSFPVPLWVVGNMTVGGTGKTALVIYLVEWLQQKGLRPGIVSRGYGGAVSKKPRWVGSDATPLEVGDEAALIVQRTSAPMVVSSDRVAAVQYLLDCADCDVVLSDDGLQHYRMQRDIEMVVVDSKRRFGNEWCLPAGPLREPLDRLRTVNVLIDHVQQPEDAPYWIMRSPTELYLLAKPACCESLAEWRNKTVCVATAIGDPQRLVRDLMAQGLVVQQCFDFPDHHQFQPSDWRQLPVGLPIITTEKDAIKWARLMPARDMWVLREKLTISTALASFFGTLC